MRSTTSKPRVILIGGTSHVGKSTFAASLARMLNWQCGSTDTLARHPGRPWRDEGDPPQQVQTYYLEHTTPVLLADVLRHYRNNVWPIAEATIRTRVANQYDPCLVLEGSAIWPELVAGAQLECVDSVWLTAKDSLIADRIKASSRYSTRSTDERMAIGAFLDRSLAFNARMMACLDRSAQCCVDVGESGALERLQGEYADPF